MGAIGYSRLNAVQKVSHVLLERAAPSSEAALQVENAIHQVLKNTYAYCIYKQPDYKVATQQALSGADEAFAIYQQHRMITPHETDQRIEKLIENVRTHAVDCLQMTDNGMTPEEIEPHLEDLGKTQVKAAVELREAASREQSRMVQGAEEIDRVVSEGLSIFIVGTLVLLLVTLGVGHQFSGLVLPPVTALTDAARRLSTGDLSVRAKEDYPSEFGVLARAFNTMAARIQDTVQENVHLAAFPRENPGLVVESDMAGNITYANPATKCLLRNLDIEQVTNLLPEQHTGIVHACLESGQGHSHIDVAVKDRIYSWSYHPIVATGMAHLYGMDVTELKQMEATRRTFERQLIQAERMASVGTVTAGIVHNLRNPLTGIMGFAQLLQMKHPDLSEVGHIVSSAEQRQLRGQFKIYKGL